MKIEYEKIETTVAFCDLVSGDAFIYDDNHYVKIRPDHVFCNKNAYGFWEEHLVEFTDNTQVLPIKARLIYTIL